MPLYPYTCHACGHAFEKVVRAAGKEVAVACPECESPNVAREFGLPAAIGPTKSLPAATNCRGDGPPCGAAGCGRMAGFASP
jgi:putative FmdB family regulatory protein